MTKIFASLLSYFLISICYAQTKPKTNLYVAGYIDENINQPSNLFVEFKTDSINLIDSRNNLLNVLVNNKTKIDSITNNLTKKKKKSFAIELPDKLGSTFDITFFETLKDVSISKNVPETLLNNTFETQIDQTFSSPNSDLQIKKSYTFSKDSLLIVHNYFYENMLMYAEKENVPYKLIEKNKLFFLEIDQSKKSSLSRFYQIIKQNKKAFSLVYYDQREKIIETFKKTNLANIPEKEFSVSLDSHPKEYYNGDYTYTKGNNYILSKISKNAPLTKGNGYITIHFAINCDKEIGRFGVEQMNTIYKPATYNPALIKHLINEIALLKDWPDFVKNSHQYDIHSFFLFKIKDGKIVDICP